MNTFFIRTCVASLFALGCAPAFSADLTGDEQTELRQRAEALQAERQRNPGWDGGRSRLSQTQTQTRSDVPLDRNRGEVKMPQRGEVKARPKSAKKAKREPVRNKVKRAAKKVPGAFVR